MTAFDYLLKISLNLLITAARTNKSIYLNPVSFKPMNCKILRYPFVCICILCFSNIRAQVSAPQKPNIIYILADDLGIGDVSGYNPDAKIKTPNIDQLIHSGVKFNNEHTSSAVCTPTRYSILTGRYNWRSRLKSGVLYGYGKELIEPGRATIASFLKGEGYTTACVGKWHLGWSWNNIEAGIKNIDYSKPVTNGPNAVGFDYSYCISSSLDIPPYVYVENGLCTEIPTDTIPGKDGMGFYRRGLAARHFKHEETLQEFTKKTLGLIRDNAKNNKPFFIYFPLSAPHTPILPSREFKGKSGLNDYGDFVLMVDDVVKQVVSELKQDGVYENTLIVFTSDNGCSPEADYPVLLAKGHNPSWQYRGTKADIFDGGHHVPFVVSWPNMITKASASDQLVCSTDFFATIAELMHQKLPDNTAEDSYSFLKEIIPVNSPAPAREEIIHHSIEGEFAIAKGDWKLIMCPGSGGWSKPRPNDPEAKKLPPIQLYNMKTDVGEKNNVYDQHPEIVSALKALLIKQINEGRSTPGTMRKNTEAGGHYVYPAWLNN